MRIRSIDAFRGLAIMLMVFFTLTFAFSRSLPDLITHNVAGSLHIGDFVLPLFLFASGMSLAFFHEKRKGKKAHEYALDVVERFGKLVMISLLLSPFSAGAIFGMDEVMLSAVLFLVCVVLIGLPDILLVLIALAVFGLYFALYDLSLLPDFSAHYLGGYPAAAFYLPVMLGGVIAGKQVAEGKGLAPALLGSGLLFVVLLLLVPPYKSEATPSFMALSVFVSLALYSVLDALLKKSASCEFWAPLEYLGQNPIRYWILMFALVKIPLEFYAFFTGLELPLVLGWTDAIAIAVVCVPVLYGFSRGLDHVAEP